MRIDKNGRLCFSVRVPKEIGEKIKKSAIDNYRTVNNEVIKRLDESLKNEKQCA